MKKRRISHKKTHMPQPKVVGNYAKPPLTNQVPPAFLTYPLTFYHTWMVNGHEVRNITEQDVLRLREFDIENKK